MGLDRGTAQFLLMIMICGGMQADDLVSCFPTETYFQSRRIPVNFDT